MPHIVIRLVEGDDSQKLYERIYSRSGKDYHIEMWSVFEGVSKTLQEKVLAELEASREQSTPL